MVTDTLLPGLRETHAQLESRLEFAAASRVAGQPRAERPAVDTFLEAVSRHNGAMLSIVLPTVRNRVEHGAEMCRELVAQYRVVEVVLNQIKGRVYGSTYYATLPWDDLFERARTEFHTLCLMEERLAEHLRQVASDDDPDWTDLLHAAEFSAPSRPHPWIPHQGVPGRAARAVARQADGFFDSTESRMVPHPRGDRDRMHEGRLTQWLLADPHLSEDDSRS